MTTWPASQPFHRVFFGDDSPTQFPPAKVDRIRGRFHSFRDVNDRLVSVLYAAEVADAAFAETIFQQATPATRRGMVFRHKVRRMAIATLTAGHDLRLIELCGHGLQKLHLLSEELTTTDPSEYSRTVAWANALHAAVPAAHGLLWMSHQLNTSKALMLFGDRVDEQSLSTSEVIRLGGRRGRELVERAATRAGITIV